MDDAGGSLRRYPSLIAGNASWRLPLSIHVASQLPACLLAEGERRSLLLTELAREDASLALWSVCQAFLSSAEELQTIGQIARWLAQNALTKLTWTDDEWADRTGAAEFPDWTARMGLAKRVARHAEALAHRQRLSESLVERCYLAGLLHDWQRWFVRQGWRSVPNDSLQASHGPDPESAVTQVALAPDFAKLPAPRWLKGSPSPESSSDDALVARLVVQAVSECHDVPGADSLQGEPVDLSANDCATAVRHGGLTAAPLPGPELVAALPHLLDSLRRAERRRLQFATELEQEKLAAVKELAYGASHEINNPLANISTRAQTLLRDEKDPERRRKLATINAQAFRAHEMISDLMLFAHPPALQLAEVHLGELIERVVGELADQALSQQTKLKSNMAVTSAASSVTSSAEAPLTIVADESLVAAALKSLCRNALEALGSGGMVQVSVERVESSADDGVPSVRLVVEDDGPGLTEEVRHHAFDPFYSGREAGRGLGLGLSKCWRVVTMHGGRVEVASEVGRGSRFTMLLPLQPAEAAPTA